ncbi:MAG: group 1 truncated hemoglobin [Myxococcales bacterium]|nr:group 1 truncated hemoglobin [Myxococcales bacterium]
MSSNAPLGPDPEMWEALDEGFKLLEILRDFYTRAYDDARLAPFFEGIPKEWVVHKQYSFMRSKFTGEKIYFGNRPRNAHHWMVISDELFDHREDLMERCLRDAKLPEHLVARWRALDEVFRKQIVKSVPLPRKISGQALPLEGYGQVTLEVGTLCDRCQAPLDTGESVHYHLRTGLIYCPTCLPEEQVMAEAG